MHTKYTKMPANNATTIKVSKQTRDELAKLGNKNETYEDIIKKLIYSFKKNKVRRKV